MITSTSNIGLVTNVLGDDLLVPSQTYLESRLVHVPAITRLDPLFQVHGMEILEPCFY